MEIPTCYRCHKELPDFDAKVMTDLPNWLNRPGVVMWVRPYCHECVSYLDQNEDGRNKYHQLWNLKDIARSPMIYFGQVILKATEEDSEGPPSKRWTAQAVRDMVDIVVMCLPDYFALDLMKGFFDWNLESERADALGERIQEQATADNLVAKTEPGAYLHALTEDEIRLLLVKMLDLYYFTRGCW
ncbi:MAG: hypothetical protein IPK17_38400 [Chloroflexi bacterium]|uniref:hypothetical protein n=1 Tax=Candidatus Flexifilum breve TaxID=3140694 RepID=UPI003135B82C|nr:hypothetical protein [Chloroflexota bacterium]